MRTERFPNQRKSKLAPRGDGPFRVVKRINDNAYQLELPGEFNISNTFNVSDLLPFDADESVLRSEPSQGGEDDTSVDTIITVPTMKQAPRTRSGARDLTEGFNQAVETLFTTTELEELIQQLNLSKETSLAKAQLEEQGIFQTKETRQREGVHDMDGPNIKSIGYVTEWPLIRVHKEVSLFSITPLE